MATKKTEPQITKKRVTLTNGTHRVVDYVREDFLDAYVKAAREQTEPDGSKSWPWVDVSTEYDAGPGGYHGQTHVPAHLDHELAGQTFPATDPGTRRITDALDDFKPEG